jgi:hypothetical protein
VRAGQVPDPARQSRAAILVLVLVAQPVLVLVAVLGRMLSVMAGTLAMRPARIVPVLAHTPQDGA